MIGTITWPLFGLIFLFSMIWQLMGVAVLVSDIPRDHVPSPYLVISALFLGPMILPFRVIYRLIFS